MAERQNPDPRRSERRQGADNTQRRQGGTSQRRPAAENTQRRQTPPPENTQRRQAPARGGTERRQAPTRRNDVIRCENCGEDYSITYKRCPFCDERPVRGGIAGKRVANTRGGGYGRPASNLRIAWWVVSFAVILCAAAIVVRFMGAPIFGGKPSNSGGSSTSQGDKSGGGTVSTPPAGGSSGDTSGTDEPPLAPGVEAVVLSALDTTLDGGKTFQLTANLLPAGVTGEVSWSSSDPNMATVDENGLVTNVNPGSSQGRATITAVCGQLSAQCTVYCNPKPATSSTGSSSRGIITGADTGLNIRSGPGTSYEKVASASNGAEVTILGEENGWYHIRYSGTSTGYVSKEFVKVG
ncbi:SH3 domain-containing protein [Pseudoflavonifractor sp. 60]|uniref:SH3 domain-containing protein n=1 Tax=Pseudoflavonifractor sp. 60 TaxID=2304576 RepID=UPI0013681C1A|nr:SH3 domain-containing protein [Pseudoflavonifractor sp. 60]